MINNPEQNALIIFARYPVLGKVKTRLASSYSKEFALGFYKECSRHLFMEITQNQNHIFTPFLFCTEKDELSKMAEWAGPGFKFYHQDGVDLGRRMSNAFRKVFTLGAKKVVIIGTDVPDISNNLITKSFKLLDDNDFVIGPSNDGGYYLLGLKNLKLDLFSGINWSTGLVLEQTIGKIEEGNFNFTKLKPLHDIDNEYSLTSWIKEHTEDYNNPVYKFVVGKLST